MISINVKTSLNCNWGQLVYSSAKWVISPSFITMVSERREVGMLTVWHLGGKTTVADASAALDRAWITTNELPNMAVLTQFWKRCST